MPSLETPHVTQVPLLKGGRWIESRGERCGDVYNPSTGRVIARVPLCDAAEAAEVVEAASAALPEWSATPVIERARLMFRYRELLETQFEDLARLVTHEHGKTLAESRAEVRRGIEVVEFACGIPSLIMGRSLPEVARGVDADVARHPVGVCVGIAPYNFPAMVPLWMFPIALVCGNTFVLKPSEKVPLSAVRLGELLMDAGCPDGVFSIVHGDRECVETLLAHPRTAAVSFVGSTGIARWVYETGTRAGKRVQAAGGAKNHFIILPDADPELTIDALASSAYGCAGQRCMATSVAVAVGGSADKFVEQLCEHAAGLRVGPTDGGENVDVGPLIRREHVERVAGYLDGAAGEGARVALDGRQGAPSPGFFLRPSLVDHVQPAMRVAREEIFGPVLSVIRARNLDEALALGQDGRFGNGASIFTRDGYAARQFRQHFSAGMIGVNVGVPAPNAWFPFTGWNGSFFGDLHVQGEEGVQFYTRQKVTLTRWPAPAAATGHDPLWNPSRPSAR
jgi:malonate-semialdehyde dehydrogenase (acetylating)/methylmalonate-semialdehyde dehydrogenase